MRKRGDFNLRSLVTAAATLYLRKGGRGASRSRCCTHRPTTRTPRSMTMRPRKSSAFRAAPSRARPISASSRRWASGRRRSACTTPAGVTAANGTRRTSTSTVPGAACWPTCRRPWPRPRPKTASRPWPASPRWPGRRPGAAHSGHGVHQDPEGDAGDHRQRPVAAGHQLDGADLGKHLLEFGLARVLTRVRTDEGF